MTGESSDEARLRQMLRDPTFGAYLNAKDTGAHYLLSSGLHTGELYQIAAACRFEFVRRYIADIILQKLRKTNLYVDGTIQIDVLIGVAMGGLPILFELQGDPSLMHTEAIWVEKERDPWRILELKKRRAKRLKKEIDPMRQEFVLGRNFRIDPDKRAVIVEDVYTTGTSIRAAIDACNDYNHEDDPEGKEDSFAEANIVGAIVVVNRSPEGTEPPEVLMSTLTLVQALRDPINYYPREKCPWCKQRIKLKKI